VKIPLLPLLVIVFSMGVAVAQLPEVKPPPVPKGTTEQRSEDETITAQVKEAISADAELKDMEFTVETANNVVTLSGTARAKDQIARAIAIARSIPGVKSVINILGIKES
jgi:osmotically-inducible protein OsmY